jgi:chorismate mutase
MAAQPAPAPDTHVPGTAGTSSEDVRSHHRPRLRALRGATTVDEDSSDQVTERTQALLRAMLTRNGVDHGDIISMLFTATDDIHSMFPATAARAIGFGDVPLLCARELDIEGAQPRCIRVMMHLETTRDQLHHIYLEGARGLRDDLPE